MTADFSDGLLDSLGFVMTMTVGVNFLKQCLKLSPVAVDVPVNATC